VRSNGVGRRPSFAVLLIVGKLPQALIPQAPSKCNQNLSIFENRIKHLFDALPAFAVGFGYCGEIVLNSFACQ
jgi:hypothetical protein